MGKKYLIILLVIALSVIAVLVVNSIKKGGKLTQTQSSVTGNPKAGNSSQGLTGVIENSLKESKGTYGIAIKNLKTNEEFYLNENKIFDPGSLYKLWLMAVTYQQIEKGILKEEDVLSQNIRSLNNEFGIPPSEAELKEGGITLTVKDALNQMITISHNYAALLLLEKIKRLSVQEFLKNYGFTQSATGDTVQTTPKEIAIFLEKLYKGGFANPENTFKMIEFLKMQTKNEKLPKYLPPETVIAHKTGEIDFFSHDAGIVYAPNGDYIIVVLSESDSPYGAEERIAQISKAVYEYFVLK